MLIDVLFTFIFAYVLIVFRDVKTVAEKPAKVKPLKVVKDVFKHLYLLFALYFFGTFAFSLYSIDASAVHALGTLPVYLLFMLPLVAILVRLGLKNNLEAERFHRAEFVLGVALLGSAVLFTGWMFIYMAFQPNFIVDALTASFPLDYAISLNIGPVLIALLSLIPGLYLLIAHFMKSRHRIVEKTN
jgi:magnesium-transporting ATPase (P-type)